MKPLKLVLCFMFYNLFFHIISVYSMQYIMRISYILKDAVSSPSRPYKYLISVGKDMSVRFMNDIDNSF